MKILKVNEKDMYCVEFSKLGGRWTTFNHHLKELKKHFDYSNDTVYEA